MTDPSQLRVHKLTLFSHGVANLELSAQVQDDVSLSLSFPERHMNDVLKSLTVVDTNDGQIASISYEAPTDTNFPPDDTLCFDGASPFKSLLESAQGASVLIQLRDGTSFKGLILGLQCLPSQQTPHRESKPIHPHTTLNLVLLREGSKLSTHDVTDLVA